MEQTIAPLACMVAPEPPLRADSFRERWGLLANLSPDVLQRHVLSAWPRALLMCLACVNPDLAPEIELVLQDVGVPTPRELAEVCYASLATCRFFRIGPEPERWTPSLVEVALRNGLDLNDMVHLRGESFLSEREALHTVATLAEQLGLLSYGPLLTVAVKRDPEYRPGQHAVRHGQPQMLKWLAQQGMIGPDEWHPLLRELLRSDSVACADVLRDQGLNPFEAHYLDPIIGRADDWDFATDVTNVKGGCPNLTSAYLQYHGFGARAAFDDQQGGWAMEAECWDVVERLLDAGVRIEDPTAWTPYQPWPLVRRLWDQLPEDDDLIEHWYFVRHAGSGHAYVPDNVDWALEIHDRLAAKRAPGTEPTFPVELCAEGALALMATDHPSGKALHHLREIGLRLMRASDQLAVLAAARTGSEDRHASSHKRSALRGVFT